MELCLQKHPRLFVSTKLALWTVVFRRSNLSNKRQHRHKSMDCQLNKLDKYKQKSIEKIKVSLECLDINIEKTDDPQEKQRWMVVRKGIRNTLDSYNSSAEIQICALESTSGRGEAKWLDIDHSVSKKDVHEHMFPFYKDQTRVKTYAISKCVNPFATALIYPRWLAGHHNLPRNNELPLYFCKQLYAEIYEQKSVDYTSTPHNAVKHQYQRKDDGSAQKKRRLDQYMSTEHICPPYDDDKFIHANIVSPGDVAQTSGEELQKSCTPAIHLLHAYQYISVRDGISLDSVHSRVKCRVEKSMTNSPAATINEYHPTAVSEIKSGSSDEELLVDEAATAKPGSPKGHLSAAASEYLPSIVSGIKPGLSKGFLFDDAANADEYPHMTVSEIILGSSGKWVLIDDAATAKAESYKGLLSDDAAAANEYLPSIVSGIQPGPSKGLLFDDAATTDEYPRSIVPEIISGSSEGHLSDGMNIPELDMSFSTDNPIEYFTNYLDNATTDEAYQFQGFDNQFFEHGSHDVDGREDEWFNGLDLFVHGSPDVDGREDEWFNGLDLFVHGSHDVDGWGDPWLNGLDL
ncbi:hypothetical protein SUGI_0139580 [Cryptomeria japonica]|nr:hypothetical protein SUGI_0139580 [Cryptomeria japonica]